MQAPIDDLRNMTWISQLSYALTFEVLSSWPALSISEAPTKRRVEVYRLKFLDSDNEEIDPDRYGSATHAQYALIYILWQAWRFLPTGRNSFISFILEIMML